MESRQVQIRLQPELEDWVMSRSADRYMTVSEYIRRLIVEDMKANRRVDNGSTDQK